MRWATLLFVFVTACAGDEDGFVVDLGVITSSFESDFGPSIEHPAVAQAGADVEVTVYTYGDDCTWAKRTDVEVRGLNAVIRPFDESAVDSFCGDVVLRYPHTASIRFEQPGTATITVFGYAESDRFGTVIQRSSTLEIQ